MSITSSFIIVSRSTLKNNKGIGFYFSTSTLGLVRKKKKNGKQQ